MTVSTMRRVLNLQVRTRRRIQAAVRWRLRHGDLSPGSLAYYGRAIDRADRMIARMKARLEPFEH